MFVQKGFSLMFFIIVSLVYRYKVSGYPISGYMVKRANSKLSNAFLSNLSKEKFDHGIRVQRFHADYTSAGVSNDVAGRLNAAGKIYSTSGPIGSRIVTYGRALLKTVV